MNNKHIKVLLIEDNPGDARLIQEALTETESNMIDLDWADRISTGMKYLANPGIDAVLLDLSLPDSQGLDTFSKVFAQAPEVPVLVLTGLDDELLAINAVQAGAQDYLVKGQIKNNFLARSIRYAIERHRQLMKMQNQSLIDELTGLYNRRGFLTLSRQQLRIINRKKQDAFLLFMDLDNMKCINDTLGHQKGDLALLETANILKATFRESDIVGRIGGDEFAVLAEGSFDYSTKAIINRLQNNLKIYNQKDKCDHNLALSLGTAYYNPDYPCSVEELLDRADKFMYIQKRNKKNLAAEITREKQEKIKVRSCFYVK